jgi:hypothetical protein
MKNAMLSHLHLIECLPLKEAGSVREKDGGNNDSSSRYNRIFSGACYLIQPRFGSGRRRPGWQLARSAGLKVRRHEEAGWWR